MLLTLQHRKDWNESFRKFSVEPTNSEWEYYFPIGTFAFVADLREKFGGRVKEEDLNLFRWSKYAYRIGEDLLNSDYCILPAAEISRLKFALLGQFGEDCKIFVRPDRGDKPFDGQILDIEEFNYFASMYEGELTIISKPKKILGEWRFAVNKGGILGVSLYKYQDNFVTVDSCPPTMRDFVLGISKRILNDKLQFCTIDVAQLTDGSFKFIEINSLHHSGLYAMKPEPIVEFIRSL
jgi:hypothetical protein